RVLLLWFGDHLRPLSVLVSALTCRHGPAPTGPGKHPLMPSPQGPCSVAWRWWKRHLKSWLPKGRYPSSRKDPVLFGAFRVMSRSVFFTGTARPALLSTEGVWRRCGGRRRRRRRHRRWGQNSVTNRWRSPGSNSSSFPFFLDPVSVVGWSRPATPGGVVLSCSRYPWWLSRWGALAGWRVPLAATRRRACAEHTRSEGIRWMDGPEAH